MVRVFFSNKLLRKNYFNTVYFPRTRKIRNENDIWIYLKQYNHVILRSTSNYPDFELMKVAPGMSDKYIIQYRDKSLNFQNKKQLSDYLQDIIETKSYVVQKYIDFLKLDNRSFYVKVIVRENQTKQDMQVTEKYIKVTNPDEMASNLFAEGEIWTINKALEHLDANIRNNRLWVNIEKACSQIAQKLKEITQINRWEFTIAIDPNGKLWMIEANTKSERVMGHKQNVYTILGSDEYLSTLLPETRKVTKGDDIWGLLDKYNHVMLKPVSGSQGNGVIKVSKNENRQYHMHHKNIIQNFLSRDQLWLSLDKKINSNNYLVQRYIHLSTIGKRPFDLRVIVQRKQDQGEWKVTGRYAKVAQEGFITTNLAKRGKVLPVDKAILNSKELKDQNTTKLESEINRAALIVATKLGEIFPEHRIWGLDIGIDSQGRIWIIEVNSRPGLKGFRILEDQSMYKEIHHYKNN